MGTIDIENARSEQGGTPINILHVAAVVGISVVAGLFHIGKELGEKVKSQSPKNITKSLGMRATNFANQAAMALGRDEPVDSTSRKLGEQ